jgi:hypothetical protein
MIIASLYCYHYQSLVLSRVWNRFLMRNDVTHIRLSCYPLISYSLLIPSVIVILQGIP